MANGVKTPGVVAVVAQPSRRGTELHSGTTVLIGTPAVANRPTISGTPNTKSGTVAAAPPPQALSTSPKRAPATRPPAPPRAVRAAGRSAPLCHFSYAELTYMSTRNQHRTPPPGVLLDAIGAVEAELPGNSGQM
ncbi:hypothetical protein GZL_08337 [Streptomyces sp. 769]|nr:hypothetical protein GZL_08337 [Streptomyces sp. 769]